MLLGLTFALAGAAQAVLASLDVNTGAVKSRGGGEYCVVCGSGCELNWIGAVLPEGEGWRWLHLARSPIANGVCPPEVAPEEAAELGMNEDDGRGNPGWMLLMAFELCGAGEVIPSMETCRCDRLFRC